jgi:hypothetical protein
VRPLLTLICLLLTCSVVTAAYADPGLPTPTTDAGNKAAAQAEADRLVKALPLPPGATVLATPPSPLLPPPGPMALNSVLGMEYWTVPGTNATAVDAFLKTHSPAGMSQTGSGTFTSTPGAATLHQVTYTGKAAAAYGAPEVTALFVQEGSAVDIRVEADLTWRFARQPASLVTGHVRKVVVQRRPTHRAHAQQRTTHVTRTVVDSKARMKRIVRQLDSLLGEVPSRAVDCSLIHSPVGFDEIDVTTSHGRWSFRETLGCIDGVSVRHNGKAVPHGLDGGTFAQIARLAARG